LNTVSITLETGATNQPNTQIDIVEGKRWNASIFTWSCWTEGYDILRTTIIGPFFKVLGKDKIGVVNNPTVRLKRSAEVQIVTFQLPDSTPFTLILS
jgi:hypothetical protein